MVPAFADVAPTVTDDTSSTLLPVFSKDGSTLIVPRADGVITVFDVTVGEEVASIETGPVSVVGLRPDGRVMVSASGAAISLWDVLSGDKIALLNTRDEKAVALCGF
jgi:WD40 repeat protein